MVFVRIKKNVGSKTRAKTVTLNNEIKSHKINSTTLNIDLETHLFSDAERTSQLCYTHTHKHIYACKFRRLTCQ